ncbi:hypothetical protein TEA_004986 [Camellia sinensis var. sinensis]|uniref:Serine-threonine/tyrosine-protein kinase catalytic domain-containing protein n=1 Tax=Camellia sinensis var. sinensis TaxID=542762 RepID=A0A4S4EDZ3_CAMSN|nr:hypothetical protein TEA_004986 [Camellia sinensis var. sinensis]
MLVRWFRTCVQSKTNDQIIDPYLVGSIAPECLREFVKISWNCLLDTGTERPSMYDVVGSLNIALLLQQIWHYDIEVGSSSHNDPVKERFCHAYNNVLSYDGAFDTSDPDTGTNGLLIKKI